jgi:hypothetical protein
MEPSDEKELWVVGREFERPPYFHVGKGGDTRLARALRLCIDGRITPNSDGSYTVEGSEHRMYRVGDSCSCPQSQKASSRWCYHAVAVALYVEWQRRLRPYQVTAPVVLGTLRAGTAPLPSDDDEALGNGVPVDDETLPLPLPPTTIDERLAVAVDQCVTHALQEDRMPDDGYIPEPDTDDAPVAVLDAPVPTTAEPVRMSIPAEYVMSIKGKRHVLYAGLVIMAQRSGLASLAADWTYNDAELSLAHAVATFSDGRRYEDSGDASPANVNKGIATHFRRVALTRAKARCLRDALGIQECSVEEMEDETPKREVPEMSQPLDEKALRRRIWHLVQSRDTTVKTREDVESFVKARTGMDLHPDFYQAIVNRLEEGR